MGAPTPDVIIEPFGTNAAGSDITLPIPVPSQLPGNPGRASFNDGFPSDTIGAGATADPYGQDFNGILYMITAYLQALTGGQFWQYNSTWEAANSGYALGAIIAMAAGNGFWINLTAGNTNNPDTTAAATSGWVPLAASGSSSIALSNSNVTLTAVQAATPEIVLTGTLTANVQVIFPPWVGPRWDVINNTAGAFTVTCKTASGTGVVVPTGAALTLFSDGTNIRGQNASVGSFTATLSGGFTSNPTGTINYEVQGNIVTLFCNSAIDGTSNAETDITISGLPQGLIPSSSRGVFCFCLVNGGGQTYAGIAAVLSGGTILISLLGVTGASQIVVPVALGTNSNSFDDAGQKGLLSGWSITYSL